MSKKDHKVQEESKIKNSIENIKIKSFLLDSIFLTPFSLLISDLLTPIWYMLFFHVAGHKRIFSMVKHFFKKTFKDNFCKRNGMSRTELDFIIIS